jgi:hypothetical protein
LSCGPADGKSDTLKSGASNTAGDTSPGSAAPSASGTNKPTGAAGNGTCLADCNPPQSLLVSFGTPVSFAPGGCIVNTVDAYPNNGNVMTIMTANCSGKPNAYALALSAKGQATTSPTLISSACAASGDQVTNLTSAQGANGFAAIYTCQHALGNYQIGLSFLNSLGQLAYSFLLPQVYDAAYSVPQTRIAWNVEAAVYGVVIDGTFQRYNEQGIQMGGNVSFPIYGSLLSFTSGQGFWNIIARPEDYDPYSAVCSKLSPFGTLECDRLSLSNVSGNVKINQSAAMLTATNSTSYISSAGFDPVTCALSTQVARSEFIDQNITRDFGNVVFGKNYIGQIYQGKSSGLDVAFIDRSSGAVVSTSGITNGSQINSAAAFALGQKLYVVVAKDNDAIMTISDQTIPQ